MAPHGKHHSTIAAHSHQQSLELLIKADTWEAVEAVSASLLPLSRSEAPLAIVGRGLGDIGKNDLLTAATSSRLILGFNVGILPHVADDCRRQGIDVRLYTVIYTLIEDMRRLLASLLPSVAPQETVSGRARVIALFKSCRKGVIIGCQVLEGRLRRGDSFRLLSQKVPVYYGRIDSLHIERQAVDQALPGQQAGIKIVDFNKAHLGDLLECLQVSKAQAATPWRPRGEVRVVRSPG